MDVMMAGVGVEAVEYHEDSTTVRTLFDPEKTAASLAVTATLAELMEVDPEELEPLHSTVDPEALDEIVRVRPGTEGDTHVTFTHEDHEITVHSYGVLTITPEHEQAAEQYERVAGK